jgi:DNA-binding CsgD family transcriptional regulator
MLRLSINQSEDAFCATVDQHVAKAFASLKLTPREAEVLFWISQGKSNHNIGVILGAKRRRALQHLGR